MLGNAKRVIVKKDDTTVIDGHGDKAAIQSRVGQFEVFKVDFVVRKNPCAAEEPGQHYVPTAGVTGTPGHQVVRNDAQQRAQLENIPALLPQDGDRGALLCQGVAFSCDGLDQSRLAAPVWTEDCESLVATYANAEILQYDFLSAHHGDIL